MTSGGLSPEELTNFRPQSRRAPTPPALGEPDIARRSPRLWLVAAATVLAVLLMGGGGAVTWRLANAASAPAPAPVVAAAPTTSTTTSPPPTAETTSPPPVVATDADGAKPTTDEADTRHSNGSPDEVTTTDKDPNRVSPRPPGSTVSS